MGALSGKIAWITGGGSGIGQAAALELAKGGATVVVSGRREAALSETQSLINEAGSKSDAQAVDLTDREAVDRAHKAILARHTRVDILVNCAGIIHRGAEHGPVAFADVLDVNLTGTMRMCSAARPLLSAARGAIVNTASMLSFFGGGLVPAYSASKGGVAQLTKSLAIAYAADRIRVNAIAPTVTLTPMGEMAWGDPAKSGPMLARIPLGRFAKPRQVAESVAYLLSDKADMIHGAILPVDGGFLTT